MVPLHQNCIRRQKSLHQQKLNRLYHFFFSKSSQTLPSSTEWSKAPTLTMIAARACKLVFVLKSVPQRKGCSKEGPPPRFNLVFKCFKPTSFWESPHLVLTSFCRRNQHFHKPCLTPHVVVFIINKCSCSHGFQ